MHTYYHGETRDHDYGSRLRNAGRSALHTTLSFMFAASLVPADAIRILAQRIEGDDAHVLVNEDQQAPIVGTDEQPAEPVADDVVDPPDEKVDQTAPEVVEDRVSFAGITLENSAYLKGQDVEGDPTIRFEVKGADLDATNSKAVLVGPGGAVVAETTIDAGGEVTLAPDPSMLVDGSYELDIILVDDAGQHGELSRTFAIDSRPPKLNVRFDNEGRDDEKSGVRYYRDEAVTATITVEEANFDPSLVVVKRGDEEVAGSWSSEGDVHTMTLTFEQDDIAATAYAFTVASSGEGADLAGHDFVLVDDEGCEIVGEDGTALSAYDSGVFAIDTTDPEISVTCKDDLKVFFGEEADDEAKVDAETYYTNAGFALALEYRERNFLADSVSTGATEAVVGELAFGADEQAETRTRTVAFEKEGAYQLDVTVFDLAGRSTHLKSQPIVFDRTAPRLNVEFDDEPVGTYDEVIDGELTPVDYYGQVRVATITVSEEHFDPNRIAIDTNGAVGAWEPGDDSGSTHRLTVTFAYDNMRNEDDSVNPYYLRVSGEDLAANPLVLVDYGDSELKGEEGETLSSYDAGYFCVDTKVPDIEFVQLPESFVCDREGALTTKEGTDYFGRNVADVMQHDQTDRPEGSYFNIETGSVIHVHDENLDLEQTRVNGKSVRWDLKWDEEEQTYYYATFAYAEGDHKAPVVHAVDKAGHKADKGEDRDFVVDLTDPKVFDFVWNTTTPQRTYRDTVGKEKRAVDVHYYNEPRSVRFAMLEHNWFDYAIDTLDLEGKARVKGLSKPVELTNGLMDLLPEGTIPEVLATRLNDLRTQAVDFEEDGPYRLSVVTTDLSGRSTSVTSETFVIDTQAPTLTVTYDNSSAYGGKYYKAPRTATITVDEHNFDPELFTITAKKRIHEGGTVVPGFFAYDPARWITEGDVHTYTVQFPADGWYELKAFGVDKANNPVTEPFEDSFVVDLTAPVVMNTYKNLKPTGSFEGVDYFADAVEITTTIKDLYVDESRTTIVDPEGTELGFADAAWEKSGPDKDGTYTYTKTWVFGEGGPYGLGNTMRKTPEVHTTDFAGNMASLDPVPFVVDRTEPTVTAVSVDRAPSAVGRDKRDGDPYQFFNQATKVAFSFSDAHLIKDVLVYDPEGEYDISPESSGITTGSAEGELVVALVDGTQSRNDTAYDRGIYLQVTDIAGNWYRWTMDRTGAVGSVQRKSRANISLNNEGIFPIALIQDGTAPVISLSGATAGTYYSAPQTVHVSVDEFNFEYVQRFDPNRVVLTATHRPNAAGADASTIEVRASQLFGSRPVYGYDFPCAADGHYALCAQFMDYAQNPSNRVEIGEFTVDTVAPVITATFDNNDVRNGRYYDAVRTATVHVVEHNFDPNLIRISTDGSIGGWRTDGDDHYLDVYFGEGNDHTLAVEGTDLAGNAAMRYEEPSFTIDLSDPTIKISGEVQRSGVDKPHTDAQGQTVYTFDDAYEGDINDDVPTGSAETLEDHHAYNGVVKPFVDFSDLSNGVHNFDSAAVTLTLESKRNPRATLYVPPQVIKADGSGATCSFEDIGLVAFGSEGDSVYDPAADDIYTITAHMTDLAGREADASMTFSVNRYGSTYYIEEVDESRHNAENGFALGYVADAPDLVVHEVNVSGAEAQDDHVVQMTYNQAPSMLAEKPAPAEDGYTVSALSGAQSKAVRDYGWSEYVYTIREGNFGQGSEVDKGDGAQGNYRVEVIGYDRASNDVSTSRYLSDPEAFGRQQDNAAPNQHVGRMSIADYATAEEARKAVEGTKTSAAVSFTLDQVPPAIEDVQIPHPLAVSPAYKASFFVSDDWTQGDSVVVRIDGVEVEDLVRDENRADGTGSYSFVIPASAMPLTFHTVEIEVEDGVHDRVSYATERFIVTTLIPELAVVGLCTAGIVGGMVLYRRRS